MVKAIVGGNWGDEGKGKITDLLAGESDIVVRFQGGANAGHTIINEYGKFVLHILPSGVFRENTVNIIAQGVAFNAESFFSEMEMLESKGVPTPQILISERAQILMPYHILFDQLEEKRLGCKSFGSTQSGIAPFYSDKYLKIGLQLSDLYESNLKEKLTEIIAVKSTYAKAIYQQESFITIDRVMNYLLPFKEKLISYLHDTTYYLNDAIKNDKKILLEGQLGALRDPDNGIYPFVTSSSPLAGFATVGAGIPSHSIKDVITVVKAYSSCVGAGTFVSELFGETADELRTLGGDSGEYGATTGRPRRMGWFDVVASKYGCMLQGTTQVALSLLDVLGYLETIPVCVGYEIDGKTTEIFPTTSKLNRARPLYKYLPGWKCDISKIKSYSELPTQAKNYIEFIEDELGYPITMISNGPNREDIIFR